MREKGVRQTQRSEKDTGKKERHRGARVTQD